MHTQNVEKMLNNDAFSLWLGIVCDHVTPDLCQLSMTVRKEMLNGFNILHGGVTFSFADSALAFICNTGEFVTVSIEASMTYHTPAKEGDRLVAIAKPIAVTNKIASYDIRVELDNGKLVAHFKGMTYRTQKKHAEV